MARGGGSAFGALLRQHRIRAGLTQEALAERAQMSARGLMHLEHGDRRPYPDTLARLAGALALTPDERAALADLAHPTHAADTPPPPTAPPDRARGDALTPTPVPPTLLIGREREIATVVALLREPGVRHVTLTGPGGTGKTRLAIAVAEAAAGDFPDGVAFAPLAALTDPELVLPAIAAALGVNTGAGESPLAAVQAAVRGRRLLLVLDNFEQVLAAATEVADLLAAGAGLTVLVTSRAVLRLRGERAIAVAPLDLPALTHLPPPAALADYAAIRLFVARARDVRADFALTAANHGAVAQICLRLDGLPLAIELAAARMRVLTVETLLARLTESLTILTGGAPDLPQRQRTLRATIGWSHNLLHGTEQALLRRLAVFVGGWTLEAADAVCGPIGTVYPDVLDGIESLLGQSLVRPDEAAGGEPRFVFLETIREFARERLVESGEVEEMRRRHAAYYIALADAANPHLFGREQGVWTRRLDRELDNLRAALVWTRDRGDADEELRLAGALSDFWWNRGYTREGRDWLEEAIARAGAQDAPASVRARAYHGAGSLTHFLGDPRRAVARLEESIACYRDAGDMPGVMRALNTLGGAIYDQGDLTGAIARWEDSLALSRAADDVGAISRAVGNIGEAYFHLGDRIRATACYEEALACARRSGRADIEAAVLGSIGNMAREDGDMVRAGDTLRQALERKAALGSQRQIGIALEDLACLAAAEGRGERAARLLGAADALRVVTGIQQPDPERRMTERAVAAARSALGEAAWAAAFAAGAALTPDDAITEAMA